MIFEKYGEMGPARMLPIEYGDATLANPGLDIYPREHGFQERELTESVRKGIDTSVERTSAQYRIDTGTKSTRLSNL